MEGVEQQSEIASSLKKIVRGAWIMFLGRILGKGIGYLYIIFIARLGAAKYGMINMGFSVASLIVVFAILGFDMGVLRYIPFYQARKDKKRVKGALTSALAVSLPISLFLALLMFFLSNYLAVNIFHNSFLTNIFRVFSLTIPFTTLASIFMMSLRAFQRVDYEVLNREILEKGVRLLFTIFFLFIGFGVVGVSISYLLSSIAICSFSLYLLEKRVFPIIRTRVKSVFYIKELLSYSLPLLFSIFLYSIIDSIGTIMLGYFKNAVDVGVYNAAVPTAALMFIFPGAFISLFAPIITQFYSKNEISNVRKIYKIVSRWIFYINLPLFLLMAVFSRQIINILFGAEYLQGAFALSVISFGYLIYTLTHTSQSIIHTLKKTRGVLWISCFFTFSIISLNILLIPKYSYNGAAIAASSSFILTSILIIVFAYRLIRLQPFQISYLKAIISAIASILIVYPATKMLFNPITFFSLGFMCAIFAVIYFIFLVLFRCLEKEDYEMMKDTLKKFRYKK